MSMSRALIRLAIRRPTTNPCRSLSSTASLSTLRQDKNVVLGTSSSFGFRDQFDDASGSNFSKIRPFSSTSAEEDQKKDETSNQKKETENKDTLTPKDDAAEKPSPPPPLPKGEKREFQAETRQLLDIVTHSLYTDKEVFLRELISNASDALEKLRHVQVTNEKGITMDADLPLEIRIETDELNGTLTISDTGIGLTQKDMIDNLGTIARSGSKAFVQELQQQQQQSLPTDLDSSIIGKFGVGFYSAFMVGDKVEVRSRPATIDPENPNETPEPSVWSSDGTGSYEIATLPDSIRQHRGTSVVIHLKDQSSEFADEKVVEQTLKKYSNFVNVPIFLNGKRVNTVQALWSKDPKEVSEEEHAAFYKFVAGAYDEPLYKLHFRADAPLEIKALFYVPSFHSEKHGMSRMEPGVSLYSRKVLIESKSPDILPDWMRFVKGVVDSEDLPLSISREKAQDSALIRKLRRVLTRKFISFLASMAKKDPDQYKEEFFREFGFFLKEGICQDFEFQDSLSKLLYFETSKTLDGNLSSFDEYVSRCTPEQQDIYYLCAPSRELALSSPYLEAFEKSGREVIFVYSAIDDFVMSNLGKYQGRSLVTAEKSDLDLGDDDSDRDKKESKGDDDDEESPTKLTDEEATEFCAWFKLTLESNRVEKARTTKRLGASPAVITDSESGALRRMMQMVSTADNPVVGSMPIPPQTVEINPSHPLIIGLNRIRETEPTLAKTCAEQIFDNCLVAAGILDDGRSMLPRLNDLLLCVVKGAEVEMSDAAIGHDGTAKAKPPLSDAEPVMEVKEKEAVDEPEFIDAEDVIIDVPLSKKGDKTSDEAKMSHETTDSLGSSTNGKEQ